MEDMRPIASSLMSMEDVLAKQITDILSQVEGVGMFLSNKPRSRSGTRLC